MKQTRWTIQFIFIVMLALLVTLPQTARGQALETYGGDGPEVHEPPAVTIEALGPVLNNGDFELGNLSGWGRYRAGNTNGWSAYTGKVSPQSGHKIKPPPQGKWAATSDQAGPSVQILYQDITLNGNYELNFTLYLKNWAYAFYSPQSLSYNLYPNQQYRVDIVRPGAPLLDVKDVLANVFQTNPGDNWKKSPTQFNVDLSPWAGQTIRLRFAEVDNQLWFNASVDDIWLLRTVDVDIKPGSCPNPLNIKGVGVLPVAVLGTADFDVFTIDPASVRLGRVAPTLNSYEDVSTPVADSEDECACTTEGPDGYVDLTLKFDPQEIIAMLGEVNDGDEFSVTLTAKDIGGLHIKGSDCVVIVDNTKPLITSVVRDGVIDDGQPTIVAGQGLRGLLEGAHAYMDRPKFDDSTADYHWESIPEDLVGSDYVVTFNEDKKKEASNVSYAVTLDEDARLYVLIDRRYVDAHGDPPFTWLTDGSAGAVFDDTGLDIILNELGGTGILRPFDVYGAEVPAGTYILGPSWDGYTSRNFYGIAANWF